MNSESEFSFSSEGSQENRDFKYWELRKQILRMKTFALEKSPILVIHIFSDKQRSLEEKNSLILGNIISKSLGGVKFTEHSYLLVNWMI